VNWIDVGYFKQETDKLNTFQLVLIDREDIAAGDFDMEFNYGKIQWEAGDASGGTDGVCPVESECSPAHAGYSDGTGTDGNYFELPGSGVPGALLDSNAASGLIYGGAHGKIGRFSKKVRSGTPEADLSIAMTPSPSPVSINANLTYTITVTNNGPNGALGAVVTDTIPTNSTYVSANSSQGSCSGTSTVTCNLNWISNGNSATVTIVVTANSGTSLSDTATVSATTADPNSENNSTGAIITPITTALPPVITKTFGAANIQVNGTTTLNFTIASPEANPATLTGIAFTDSLPSGLLVATPNGLSTTCSEASITATAGSGSVSLAGYSQAPGASCTITVNVTGTTVGTMNNSISVSSTNGGAGNNSTARLAILSAPTLTAAFGASSIPLNGTTSLTFTVTNTSSANSISGVGFTDTLPAGLVVATPNNGLTGSGGGGAITAAGSSSISLTGATLPQVHRAPFP